MRFPGCIFSAPSGARFQQVQFLNPPGSGKDIAESKGVYRAKNLKEDGCGEHTNICICCMTSCVQSGVHCVLVCCIKILLLQESIRKSLVQDSELAEKKDKAYDKNEIT